MSRLKELIKQLCPTGVKKVQVKYIKKDSFWLMPSTPKFINEGIPYITSKNIKNGVINFSSAKYISKDDYISMSSNRKIEKNDLLITMIGTIGEVAFVDEEKEFYGQNMYLIRLDENIVNRNYFYYYLTSPSVRDSLVSNRNKSSQGYIKAGSLENLQIPIPPMEVQKEIVRILENFTDCTVNLIENLTIELSERKKQYEYYRDEILNSSKDENVVTIGEVVEKVTTINWNKCEETKKYIDLTSVDKELNYIINELVSNVNSKNAPSRARQVIKSGDLLFGGTRPMLKRYCIVPKEYDNQVCSTGYIVLRVNKNVIMKEYLYYILGTQIFYDYVETNQKGTSYPSISDKVLKQYKFKLPPLHEQERVINILSRYEKLSIDIITNLSTEIEARKKQYEYYRDKLLTFKELKDEHI